MMLLKDEVYTFKVQSGDFLNFTSEEAIKKRAALLLLEIATVHSVERPGGLQYYYLRITPDANIEAVGIVNLVRQAFNQLGYENAAVLSYERGEREGKNVIEETAKSGGEIVKPVGDFLITIVKWLALGIAAGLVIYLIIRRSKA